MNKVEAAKIIRDDNLSVSDIAQSIYLATVCGVSGADQHGGQGYTLSAIAVLWNITGTINNPNANRNTITRRYAGKNVTQDRIFQIIRQYPDGIGGTFPLFDDLVFGRGYGSQDDYSVMDGDAAMSNNDFGGGMSQMSSRQNQDAAASNSEEQLTCVIVVIIFLICKLGLHLGWIASILIGLLGGGILTAMIVGEK